MTLRELVKEALENAADNGFTFEGMSDVEVAEDMIEFNAELEDYSVEDLLPHIQELRQ